MRYWLALAVALLIGGLMLLGMEHPIGHAYPRIVHYSPKCAGIVQEYLHQGSQTFLTSDRWMTLMQRVDQCEHPESPWWRAAYARDSEEIEMRPARPQAEPSPADTER